ncbi:MAG: PD40 domain-containing protein [Calditrichaceae bacterium]|nr:PD40 domain-containing protein [Calditrichaceae bacterium]MBN2710037.1 PD40 domain-containing protein [Calditrichaceae bacterium]RQV92137.1 MAG: cytochrome C biosynthesis protein [Calditrichota bacterium]
MKTYHKYIGIIIILIIIIIIMMFIIPGKAFNPDAASLIQRMPDIDPDYTDIILPPNIAPLNFKIKEPGNNFYVKIYSEKGEPVEINSSTPKIEIPLQSWKKLLAANKGQEITIKIYAETDDGNWNEYRQISNFIAEELIDSHLAYRLIMPAHNFWNEIGIYQRNLENFDESPILVNKLTDNNCMNCHNFKNNDPDNMVMHLRGGPAGGTLLIRNGQTLKINTATDFNQAGAYPSWHPDNNRIAFSVNNLTMFFHAKGTGRDVLDKESDIIIYQIESNTITTSPKISDPQRMETFPCWSPDGKYLYFCSAPMLQSFVYLRDDSTEDLKYDNIRYDLMRVAYNAENNIWGELETVLSSSETGKTILEPRISPDGRYALLTMASYGNFPIYMTDSDVYLLDLDKRVYKRLDINSDRSDSFHAWSSNGRWFVFASKRRDGVCGNAYFSYFDQNGNTGKPFIMPQEDPEFYDTFFRNYNVPELIKGPVKSTPQQLARIAGNKEILNAVPDPVLNALKRKGNKHTDAKTTIE